MPLDHGKASQVLRTIGRELALMPWEIMVNVIAPSHVVPTFVRTVIYRLMGLDVSWGAQVKPEVTIRDRALKIGPGTTINLDCYFDNRVSIVVGRSCGIGPGVRFITSGHELTNPLIRAGEGTLKEIVIGDGSWIGSGATILGGVSVGPGCVIAAGAVVVSDCEANALYGGVPARYLKRLSD